MPLQLMRRLQATKQVTLMGRMRTQARRIFVGLLCFSLVVWSVAPSATHAPKVLQTINDHLEMIADHGHSHGFEEDLFWALHGHSHDVADHDHSQVVLSASIGVGVFYVVKDTWRLRASRGDPFRDFRIDRPPRA